MRVSESKLLDMLRSNFFGVGIGKGAGGDLWSSGFREICVERLRVFGVVFAVFLVTRVEWFCNSL